MDSAGWGQCPKAVDYLDDAGQIRLPEGTNLIEFLDRTVAALDGTLAYRYMDYTHEVDGRRVDMTWGELGTRSRAVAARLQQVTGRGERVAVMAPQGIEYIAGFFAAITAGNVSVPLFAPDLPGHAERLEAVVTDARPSVILTTAAAAQATRSFVQTLPRADRPRIIAIDDVPDSVAAGFRPTVIDTDDVAYLQYTSGSTRTPTGVEITHRAAGTNLVQMALSLSLDDWSIHGVSWLPLYHDMGLLMIAFPALTGGYLTFMSPMAFVRKPQRWLRVLSDESRGRRVVSAAPNFAYELAAERGIPADTKDFDLGNITLINGSEPVSIESISKFNKTFAPYGLRSTAVKPSYGMAEATLFVATTGLQAEATAVYLDRAELAAGRAARAESHALNAVAFASCGQPARSQWAVIVDRDSGAELPDGRVGEIWLHGDNIGRGYWARPDETAEVFGNRLRSRLPEGSHAAELPADEAWLSTGDLGVYLDGELYITGRVKDLIILDGRNHYPQDIEATVSAASRAVRSGYVAAFAIPGTAAPRDASSPAPGERLVVVAERATGAGRMEPQPVVDAIRAAVSRQHGIAVSDVRLVAAGSIPRTTSGKLARRACREQYLGGRFDEPR